MKDPLGAYREGPEESNEATGSGSSGDMRTLRETCQGLQET